MSKRPVKDDAIIDVAIVGGGISGVYSGWRLLSENPGLNVQLFEMSDRIGGRLLSLVPPGISDGNPVEVGGMRFTNDHHNISGLVSNLGLQTTPLAAGKAGNLAYLRGKRLHQSDLTDPAMLPYTLVGDETTPQFLGNLTATAAVKSLQEAFQEVLNAELTLDNLGNVTEAQWRQVAEHGTFEGIPLGDTPMRYMMLRSMSHEAFQLAEDSSGYDSILFTWNGADGFPWNLADFSPDTHYSGIVGGYNQVPLLLADRFTSLGGQIQFQTELRSFTQSTLSDGNPGITFVLRDSGGNETTHEARSLILAMPRRSIELLDPTGPVLDPSNTAVRTLIESVTPIPLFKIALCYEMAWWEKVIGPDSSGKSATDLPIRQCYYWHVDKATGHGVILIYDDGLDLKYWEDLRGVDAPATPHGKHFEHAPHILNLINEAARTTAAGVTLPDWCDFPAPQRMVDEVHRQIAELHGLNSAVVPQPYAAAYRDWGEDPFGGGANFWRVGVRSYDVEQAIIQPVADVPVFVCGDCWSHYQGWAEGALVTAEMMLQGHFQLPPPPWAKKNANPNLT
jgi:monoamine oxidase